MELQEKLDLWNFCGLYIFPLLCASASIYWERSKEVNKSCCRGNFGLGTFYRGGFRAVFPSFVMATCVNVGKSTVPVHI